jgi:antitoxin (DNA-binding transcriptional repressor) of toxin-antitoxin stability system
MIGILLALALSQQPAITCTVVNFNVDTVQVVCGKDELAIPHPDWPAEQWGRAIVGETYPITADGKPIALTVEQRQAQEQRHELARARVLAEIQNQRIQPLQKSGP